MIGLNIDMSDFSTLGGYQSDSEKKVLYEVNSKYPISNDCVSLDITLKKLKDRISEITVERLAGYNVGMPRPDKVKNATYDYLAKYEKAYNDRATYVNKLFEELPKRILAIENKLVELNCRNEIEKIRLQESAEILTQQSAKSEQNFLKGSNTEQYIYIGAGALVLLVGVYVILKK